MFEILPDIPRVYTGIAEFLACFLFIVIYSDNKVTKSIFKIIFMGIGQIALQVFVGSFSLNLWVFGMIMNIVWMVLTIYTITPLKLNQSLYVALKAFVIAEFIASIAWQIYTFFLWGNTVHDIRHLTLFIFAIYIVLLFAIYYINKKFIHKELINTIGNKEITHILFITSIVFLVSNLGFLLTSTRYDLGNYVSIYTVRSIATFNGLCLIFLFEIQYYDFHLKAELEKINKIFGSKQYEKYIIYKENSETIKHRLHDLKHMVYVLKVEEDESARNSQINKLVEEINTMGVYIDTGNVILDTILTSKNSYCVDNKIVFSCLADGKLLNHLDVLDICNIFGNAFDNAVEFLIQQEKIEKRLINLKIIERGNFVVIRFENYCDVDIVFNNGLPETTKSDKLNHGYGLKSIKYTVKKYNGTMTVEYINNWFVIKILLPINSENSVVKETT